MRARWVRFPLASLLLLTAGACSASHDSGAATSAAPNVVPRPPPPPEPLRLVLAWRSNTERDEARLPALFGMSDETFRGKKEDLHYAMARYLCQWLDAHGWLWSFYQKWRDSFAADPTGSAAFTGVVGKTPEAANEEWQRWVRAL